MAKWTLAEFRDAFFGLTEDWSWEVQGFLDCNNFVHPIDTDTKVISTVFERMAAPVIRTLAKQRGYVVELANQTTYPDFTLTNKAEAHRIGLDIKTTYVRTKMVFTLGGYNSFIRNDTKNILYPYSTYTDHWVLGYVYEQLERFAEYDLDDLPKPGQIGCPYRVKSVLMREKHELSGLRAGSGNTKNIGSFGATDVTHFTTQMGPFAAFTRAKAACDYYWANYERLSPAITNANNLVSHLEFAKFL